MIPHLYTLMAALFLQPWRRSGILPAFFWKERIDGAQHGIGITVRRTGWRLNLGVQLSIYRDRGRRQGSSLPGRSCRDTERVTYRPRRRMEFVGLIINGRTSPHLGGGGVVLVTRRATSDQVKYLRTHGTQDLGVLLAMCEAWRWISVVVHVRTDNE